MEVMRSENVQHGFMNSWIDYDRPWLFRRQILVSQYQSSILSNLIAIALTLTGPRLWILLKALWAFLYYNCKRRFHKTPWYTRSHSPSNRVDDGTYQLESLMNSNIIAAAESHSELGAARQLIFNMWEYLRTDQIRLTPNGSQDASPSPYLDRCKNILRTGHRIWKNFLQNPFDIATSILVSVVLVGIFVAESSAGIASSNIISDTTAQVSSSKCSIMPLRSIKYSALDYSSEAAAYSRKCYGAALGSSGCNDYFNQTIRYTERANDTCPFKGETCAEGRHAAHTFDTGYINAKYIGLNSARKFYFRRRATCIPLGADDVYIKTYNNGSFAGYSIYGRRSSYRLSHSYPREASVLAHRVGSFTNALDPLFYLDQDRNSSVVTFIDIYVPDQYYNHYRSDPIFPAINPEIQKNPSGIIWKTGYYHSNETTTILACVDLRQICQQDKKLCWNVPYGELANLYPRYHQEPPTEKDLAYILLHVALSASSISEAMRGFGNDQLEANSHCSYIRCRGLPDEQWKVEARRWFQASLARIQLQFLKTVRGTSDTPKDFYRIPPIYRGMCSMGKFKSAGWRNVSFWGFFGLFFLSAAISLGSVTTAEGDLWLMVGFCALKDACIWGLRKVKNMWRWMMDTVSHLAMTLRQQRNSSRLLDL